MRALVATKPSEADLKWTPAETTDLNPYWLQSFTVQTSQLQLKGTTISKEI